MLPDAFCWTRVGTESGQTLEEIIDRKEAERALAGGTFLWGIGNGVGMAVLELARTVAAPEVLFSPIRTRPRPIDTAPPRVAAWTGSRTVWGESWPLPPGARVLSGAGEGSRLPPRYALVCRSERRLALGDLGRLRMGDLHNLVSGRAVGASQVTAVVTSAAREGEPTGSEYKVAMRAQLVYPFVVRLTDPVFVAGTRHAIEPVLLEWIACHRGARASASPGPDGSGR